LLLPNYYSYLLLFHCIWTANISCHKGKKDVKVSNEEAKANFFTQGVDFMKDDTVRTTSGFSHFLKKN